MRIGQVSAQRLVLFPLVGWLIFGILILPPRSNAADAGWDLSARCKEEIVFVRSQDGITNAGAKFSPLGKSAKPVAVIWVHGWGQNFYYPTYVNIARSIAEEGLTCITVNTRMHDIGTNAGERNGKRVRGGGYWGVASEETRDLAAWVDFAASRGFSHVVLVGHSAGWAAVRGYQCEKQDHRVIGIVAASGAVRPGNEPPDPEMLAQATRLVAEGKGDDLLRFPAAHRTYPSFVSAATYLDTAKTPVEQADFYGVQTANPAITRVHCPILVWFGTNGDVGNKADLDLVNASVKRRSNQSIRVETVMIKNADHMYTGQEKRVAEILLGWIERLER